MKSCIKSCDFSYPQVLRVWNGWTWGLGTTRRSGMVTWMICQDLSTDMLVLDPSTFVLHITLLVDIIYLYVIADYVQ